MSWTELREGLLRLDLPRLSVDQLRALLKFGVPTADEATAINQYLQVCAAHCLHMNTYSLS